MHAGADAKPHETSDFCAISGELIRWVFEVLRCCCDQGAGESGTV